MSTSPSYYCCCEPEIDPALPLIESRHHALDSPCTSCIRVPSPLNWDRNNVRELHAQRRHVLGDGGRGSILTASPFSFSSTIGVPAANCCLLQIPGTKYMVPVPGIIRTAACYKYLVPNTWYLYLVSYVVRVVSVKYEKIEMVVFTWSCA